MIHPAWPTFASLREQFVRAQGVLEYVRQTVSMSAFEGRQVFHYSIPAIQETGDGQVEDASSIESDKLFLSGDELLVSRLNPHKGVVHLTSPQDFPIVCSTEFVPLRARETVDRRFAYFVFSSEIVRDHLQSLAASATRSHSRVEPGEIYKLYIPLPPLSSQRAIAAYLDRETAKIDAMIDAKELLLTLLAEKRRALITHAVTRGLNPEAPMKDSGVEWLGEIPEHWSADRLKFHMTGIEQGWSPQCLNMPAGPDEWGVLKAGCVNGLDFDPDQNKTLPPDLDPRPELEVKDGDVLMSRSNTVQLLGSTALVGPVRSKLILCDKFYRLCLNPETIHKPYLVYLLRSPMGRFEFERDATGASNSMQNIGQDSVKNVLLPIPPLPEQVDIAHFIRDETAQLDAISASMRGTVELLKERRSALIAAAVTGQIDVEDAA